MKTATANGKPNGKKGGAKFDFTPTEFDRDTMPPPFPAGEWEAKLVKATVGPTKKKADGSGGYPMVTVEFKITGASKKHKNLVGQRRRAYLVMPPKGAPGERMMKLNLRAFCQNFDVELDTLPTGRITKTSQFSEFLAAIKGVEGTIWTTIEENNGEESTSIRFKAPAAPKGKGKLDADDEEEEDDETEDAEGAEDDEDEEEDEEDDEDDETEDSDEDEEEEDDEDEDEEEEEERPVVRGKKPAKGNVTPIAAATKRGPGRPRKDANA